MGFDGCRRSGWTIIGAGAVRLFIRGTDTVWLGGNTCVGFFYGRRK